MTAEVALLNKQAVALAADSKATFGSGMSIKTYDSVDKLFQLSNRHPVGVMIYGNAEFMRVPWEVIIKEYREHHDTAHASIEEWGHAFFEFAGKFQNFTLRDSELAVFTKTASFLRAIEASALVSRSLEPLIADVEARRVHPALRDLSENEFLKNFPELLERYADLLQSRIGDRMNNDIRRQLPRLLHRLAIADIETVARSGIVIAGFGARETFPSLINLESDGVIAGRLAVTTRSESQITVDHPADVLPFAVRNVMISMVHGVDPSFLDYSLTVFRDLIRANGDRLINQFAKNQQEKSRLSAENAAMSDEFIGVFLDYLRDYIQDMHLGPFASTLQGMPPDEMAWLAESLVHLTSVKMRMSLGPEGVGGPVDTAVITKREGFKWVKRKAPIEALTGPGDGQGE
ncbi:hypothetical protein V0U79_11310 [Hyphobacterium sp. HN65]|uniref:Uncharacterized protein n=1 Tax=Hyphobacterium lacteum TaxID=3116575 RepID=A0ABU7LSR2_9PROT|nr:hypothetical protein [Hyphobacterium sp. HN65]MEE2526960.1 hypothetical protein [Hyphobacterium sp. HN65]